MFGQTKVKIIPHQFPPNIDKITEAFGIVNPLAVFTYGDTIYNPGGGIIDSYLETHELIHQRQQTGDPEGWWEAYLADPEFRLDQELEAYGAQYRHYCYNKKDLGKQQEFLIRIANDLSGPMYGNLITFDEAIKLIKERAYGDHRHSDGNVQSVAVHEESNRTSD